MLQAVDDYPFHQTVQPFESPHTGDPRWFDRYWFMTGSVERNLVLITGIGTYPNSKRLDGYAMISDGTTQWNLRVGRERDPDPRALHAHGLGFTIAVPMEQWKLACSGWPEFDFDLRFDQRFPPNNLPPLYVERDGEVVMEMAHFAQGGGMSGSVSLGDRRVDVGDWPAQRDHSWGRRPPSGKVASGVHVWLPAQVGDREIWVWFRENARGELRGMEGLVRHRDGRSWPVTDVQHELEVSEEVAPHRQLVHARLQLTLEGAPDLVVDVEPLIPVFISGGGYVDGELAQGSFEGATMTPFSVAGDGRREIPLGIIDHFSRVTVDGEVGQGVFELSLGRYEPLGMAAPVEHA